MSAYKIYLGSVVYRFIESCYHDCVIRLVQQCARDGIDIEVGQVRGDALISRSRSLMASAFLRSDADVLLTIDSDIWFRPEDALGLCQKALDYDMIGACYVTRSAQPQPAMLLPPGEQVLFMAATSPVEVPFISTGFMAVSRKPFEALRDTLPHCHQNWRGEGDQDRSFWPFYMPYTIPWPGGDVNMYLSEDWAFCQRARDAGFKVWLDPSIRLGHNGDVLLTLEDLVRPARPEPGPIGVRRQPDGRMEAGRLVPATPASPGIILPNGHNISDLPRAMRRRSGR